MFAEAHSPPCCESPGFDLRRVEAAVNAYPLPLSPMHCDADHRGLPLMLEALESRILESIREVQEKLDTLTCRTLDTNQGGPSTGVNSLHTVEVGLREGMRDREDGCSSINNSFLERGMNKDTTSPIHGSPSSYLSKSDLPLTPSAIMHAAGSGHGANPITHKGSGTGSGGSRPSRQPVVLRIATGEEEKQEIFEEVPPKVDNIPSAVSAPSGGDNLDSEGENGDHTDHSYLPSPKAVWFTSFQERLKTVSNGAQSRTTSVIVNNSPTKIRSHNDSPLRGRSRSSEELAQASWFAACRNPTSGGSIMFKLLGGCFLAFDITLTPYVLAWDVPTEGFFLAFVWASVMFWTLDIMLSFWLGYFHDGTLIVHQKQIAIRYLKSWFVPDMTLVLVDLVNLISTTAVGPGQKSSGSGSTASGLKLVRIAKLGKFLRVLSLLRALRYMRVLQQYADTFFSDMALLFLSCFRWFILTMWLTHLMGCIWFAIGRYGNTDTGLRWTDMFRDKDASVFAEYVTSFQWAMSMVTLGSMDVVCVNVSERLFNIFCFVLGLAGSSILVSALSAALVGLQFAAAEKVQRLRTLRKYLHENRVSPGMVQAVQQQVANRIRNTKRLAEGDVQLLDKLSITLRCELRFEIMGPQLTTHPLFRLLCSLNQLWCQRSLIDALNTVFLQPHDDLFLAGKGSTAAYYLDRGHMIYVQDPSTSPVDTAGVTRVDTGTWLAEADLWMDWVHMGQAKASDKDCALLAVSGESFTEACLMQPEFSSLIRGYSRVFHRRVRHPVNGEWPNDLEVVGTNWVEMVFAMDTNLRQTVSYEALDTFKRKLGIMVFGVSNTVHGLEEEIDADKCVVIVDTDGDVRRVVNLMLFRITRPGTSTVLAELGRYQDGSIEHGCKLPGQKRKNSESESEAKRRIMEGKLEFLEGSLNFRSTRYEVRRGESASYGVSTMYRKAVVHCDLVASINAPVATIKSPFMPVGAVPTGPAVGQQSTLRSWPTPMPPWMSDLPVYFVSSGGSGGTYYAWLDVGQLDYLQNSNGKDLLHLLELLGPPALYRISHIESQPAVQPPEEARLHMALNYPPTQTFAQSQRSPQQAHKIFRAESQRVLL